MAGRWTTGWFTGDNHLLTDKLCDKLFGCGFALVEDPSPLPISCESAGLFTACKAEACSSSASSTCTPASVQPHADWPAFHEGLHYSSGCLTVIGFQEPGASRKLRPPSATRTCADCPQHAPFVESYSPHPGFHVSRCPDKIFGMDTEQLEERATRPHWSFPSFLPAPKRYPTPLTV